MEKNKNKADLLAAGRKKLEQYKKKKDGKGKKSSKANKTDRDVATGDSSKPPPVQVSDTEPVESSSQSSTDNLVAASADMAPPDLSSTLNVPIEVSKVDVVVPNEDVKSPNNLIVSPPRKVVIEGEHDSGFSIGLKAVLDGGFARGEDQVPDVGTLQEGDHSKLEKDDRSGLIEVKEDVKMENTSIEIEQSGEEGGFFSAVSNADVNSASGFPSALESERGIGDSGDGNADVHSASGIPSSSDQEPSIGDSLSGDANAVVHSASGIPISDHEPGIGDSGDANVDVHPASGLLSSDHEPGIGDSGDTALHSVSGLPSSSDHEPSIGDSGVTNADEHSPSELSSVHLPRIGDSSGSNVDVHSVSGLPSSGFETAIGDSGDTNVDVPVASEFPSSDQEPSIGDSGDAKPDVHSVSGLHSSSHEPGIGDSGVTNAFQHSLSALLSSDYTTAINDSGDTNADEFPEKFKEQLYINNFEKELVRLQLSEERNARKDFEQHNLQWVNEKSSFTASITDLESKNKTLSEELSKCRSELDAVSNKMEELEMSVPFLKTELDWSSSRIQELQTEVSNLSSELVDSKSLVSDLQSKNEILNVNVASLTNEKEGLVLENEKLVKELMECKSLLESSQVENVNVTSLTNEKEGLVMENEKLIKELMECKSLLESSQVENVNVKESLALVMDERAKLEEAKEKYLSEKDKLLSDWKKLDEVLALEREERSKHTEANEHFIQENNKVSMELFESKKLMESLQSEIANLKENLDMVTKERSKLEEDMSQIRSEKEFLKDQSNNLEETFLKNVILDEFMKQYVSTIEAKKGELVILCEDLKQESIMTKRTNSELTEKLQDSESRIQDLQEKIEDANRAHNLLSDSYKDMTEKTKDLESTKSSELTEKLQESESRIQDLQEKLEEVHRAHSLLSDSYNNMTEKTNDLETRNSELTEKLQESESRIQDLQEKLEETHRAHSLLSDSHKEMTEKTKDLESTKNSELTEKLHNSESRIQDLQEKLEEVHRAHNLLSESYNNMTEKTKDLESTNELAAYVIHKVFDNLQKLVNETGPTTESEDDTSGQLDHLEVSNYDVFIDRLIMILHERAQLEIKNREYNLELIRRNKDLEELNKKFNNPDFALLGERLKSKESQITQLTFSITSYEIESQIFKESLKTLIEQIGIIQSESKIKETELLQSENRVSALREKLHIAVTKGKGLIQQRDSLKQNLLSKDSVIQELETKVKSYSEAGERMEALESELSYIRHSATALRESFLLKDSTLQRIEEILEDLDLPEHFHDRDIIEKIDWLAKSVSDGPSQPGVIERAHSYPGSVFVDGLQEELEPVNDELKRNYEELQNKFYELAEQNEMLEQSLMERNNLVQRCEEVLEKTNMPLHLRSLETEERIDWLRVVLEEVNDRCALLEKTVLERDGVVKRCEEVLEKTNLPLDLPSLEEKIDWLCEANDRCALLEKTLMEKDGVVKRCEEVLEKTDLPLDLRSLELEEKIGWLCEANDRCALLEKTLMERDGIVMRCEEVLERTELPLDLRSLTLEEKIDWLCEANDRCALLQERHYQMQRCEEVLEKTNVPPHVQSLEPEAKIDWLRVALGEANDRCALLQQDLEEVRGSLFDDIEKSNKRFLDLEANIKSITDEKEQIFARFKAQSQDYNKVFEKVSLYEIENEKLQNEIGVLQSKLDEKRVDEDHIKQLQDMVKNMLQDQETEIFDSSMNDIECLEVLLLKLEEKYPKYPSGERSIGELEVLERRIEVLEGDLVQVKEERDKHMEKSQSLVKEVEALESKSQELQKLLFQEEQRSVDLEQVIEEREKQIEKSQSLVNEVAELEVKNQELQKLLVQEEQKSGDLVHLKEEREKLMEKSQSLVKEVEALESKSQELQKLLVQEEQKTGVVREKLNVAVRKGKSLVQQRDSMKQTINELTAEVARLTSEVKVRENTLLGYQEKMKDLFSLQESVENKDSEIGFLKNRLEEILTAFGEINVGIEFKSNNPIEKIQEIEKRFRDLQDGMLSAEQDSRKSKRAAELLLEELNEVQERNEDLLEEVSKVSKEKELAESAMRDSLSHLEQLSAVHLEERNSQFEELMKLKSDFEELKPELSKIYNLVNDVLPKDLENFYNLESSVKSLVKSSDVSKSGGISSRKDSKENLHSRLFSDTKREERQSDNEIIDLWRFIGTHMEDLITSINLFEEKLQNHSKSLHQESIILSETISTLHKEIKSTSKQKDTENSTLRKNTSMLYEACKNSIYEFEKVKGQTDSNDDLESSLFIEGEPLSVSEERIVNIVNRLLSHVKNFHNFQTENVEEKLKEMKGTISSLQKELTEKDVQKDRMCVDLVSQIKRAETSAMNNLQELESSKDLVNDLKGQLESSKDQINGLQGQLEAVNVECSALKQRVKEVEEGKESVLVDLQEKVKSLTHALTAKEQEAEGLLQALDEEEAQMEDLTNKITELEKQIHQKIHNLETTESARAKTLKKLSITVNKFDELHHLSETLVSEIDNLQSQIQERDQEISFLRNEITRCTSDSLQALESDKKGIDGIQDVLTWLESQDLNVGDNGDQVVEYNYKEMLKGRIEAIVVELKEMRQVAKSKDELLNIERSKVEDLNRRREVLESSLTEQVSRLSLHQDDGATSMTSEIVEVEPLINKWQPKGTSMAPQVRSLRKVNNDQLAISIDDVDSDEKDKLEDEDDDKSHGFKSLTTSKLVPKFTRPVTNFVDGLWVSCDRALQRQPVLRLSLILYWALMHALLAAFVV